MSNAAVILKKGEGRTIKAGGMWVFDNEIACRIHRPFSIIPGCPYPPFDQLFRYRVFLPPRHHPYGNLRLRIDKPISHEIAVEIMHFHGIPIFKRT